jgi:heme oxygenase
MFSKALLTATYQKGAPGKLTKEHKEAEYHRFKADYLFKNKIISKELYVARLIQHFLMIKAIETELQNLSNTDKTKINAFFTLAYLEQLWRTPAIEKDLRQLGVDPNSISKGQLTKTTEHYLKNIEKLSPTNLLAHFLLHVVGFMHGGNIISKKYIEPSNRLTSYQISTEQYNFSPTFSLFKGKPSSIGLYEDMMKQINDIELDSNEYEEVLAQCKGIYSTMTSIYDELCDLQVHHPKQSSCSLSMILVSMMAILLILKLMSELLNSMKTDPHLCSIPGPT